MNRTTKILPIALLMAFAIASVASAQVVAVQSEPSYTVSFSGEASESTKPDVVWLNLTVEASGKTPTEAMETQAAKAKKLLDALKKELGDSCVVSSHYSLQPTYDRDSRVLTGFQVYQNFSVTGPVEKAVKLVEMSAADSYINRVSFGVSNADERREKLVKKAVADAKAKATKRAGEVGIKLGRIVGYSESGGRRSDYYDDGPSRAMRAGSSPELPTGERTVSVSVTLTYEIKR